MNVRIKKFKIYLKFFKKPIDIFIIIIYYNNVKNTKERLVKKNERNIKNDEKYSNRKGR